MSPSGESIVIGPHDVLLGRGAPIAEYEGNVRLRLMVSQRHSEYVAALDRFEKHRIALEVIHEIYSKGGRFLRRKEQDTNAETAGGQEEWEVSKDQAEIHRKVKQLLRDVGPEARVRRAERKRNAKKRRFRSKNASDSPERVGPAVGATQQEASTSFSTSMVSRPLTGVSGNGMPLVAGNTAASPAATAQLGPLYEPIQTRALTAHNAVPTVGSLSDLLLSAMRPTGTSLLGAPSLLLQQQSVSADPTGISASPLHVENQRTRSWRLWQLDEELARARLAQAVHRPFSLSIHEPRYHPSLAGPYTLPALQRQDQALFDNLATSNSGTWLPPSTPATTSSGHQTISSPGALSTFQTARQVESLFRGSSSNNNNNSVDLEFLQRLLRPQEYAGLVGGMHQAQASSTASRSSNSSSDPPPPPYQGMPRYESRRRN